MIKVLWADDQQDVAKTLSAVLAPDKHKITFVKSGQEALAAMIQCYFDLAIVDLMMPPHTWGGLWLLEELKKATFRIPVIILSGEGTQNETIKALRLGAKDYVTKSTVQAELLQQIETVLANSWKEIQASIFSTFPILLSLPYNRYIHSIGSVSQVRKLINFYEYSLRLCSIVGMAELGLLTGGPILSLWQQFSGLARPSMGSWNQLRLGLTKRLPRDSAFYQLNEAFDNRMLSDVIAKRNDFAHGSEPSEPVAEELLKTWKPNVQVLLKKIWQKVKFRIIFGLSLGYNGKEVELDGLELTGVSPVLPKFSANLNNNIITEQTYLYFPIENIVRLVNLHPFLVMNPAQEPNAWQIFVFDGYDYEHSSASSGQEIIHYIEMWSGIRSIGNEISESERSGRSSQGVRASVSQ